MLCPVRRASAFPLGLLSASLAKNCLNSSQLGKPVTTAAMRHALNHEEAGSVAHLPWSSHRVQDPLVIVDAFARIYQPVAHFAPPQEVRAGDNRDMRKRILGTHPNHAEPKSDHHWLDLEQIATVEVTSEDPSFPIESVFSISGSGWRASQKGEQQIRILFDRPLSVHRIRLQFLEPELERTQEFALRWSSPGGGPTKEIVRQQWNFSPAGSTSEVEDYDVDLDAVSELELTIKPDLNRGEAPATLATWRVA